MSLLSSLVPKFVKNSYDNHVKNKFYRLWQENFLLERAEVEKTIPKYELEQKHIDHLQILLNRDELLKRMPRQAICAEIGVNEGEFSEKILKITEPSKLHLIDAWGDPSRYHDGLKLTVKNKFKQNIEHGQVEVNVGFSTTVLKNFHDHYFDWVYLDTDHTYKVTAEELWILKDKVKPNGIIAGHDYTIGNWPGDCRYGVIEAVHEICLKDNWELIFLTSETDQFRSFAINRIARSN
jgi:hypothetical protein